MTRNNASAQIRVAVSSCVPKKAWSRSGYCSTINVRRIRDRTLLRAGRAIGGSAPSSRLAFLLEGTIQKLSERGSEAVHLRMPPEQLATIDRAAERELTSRSELMRELLHLGLKARAMERLIASLEAESSKGKRSSD